MMMKPSTLPLLLFLLLLLFPAPSAVLAQEKPEAQGWAVGLGVFDTAGNPVDASDLDVDRPAEGTLEYRFRPFLLAKNVPLIPTLGVSATTEGSVWVFGSLRYDWQFAPRWFLTPTTGVALYDEGSDGKDLGGVLEFRSGIEIAHQLRGGSRVGLFFYHLSNADVYELNPGNNSLVLTWSF